MIFADVEEQYKKFPELKREDIKILKEWMNKQSHLPQITDLKLMIFLSGCIYNIEATKRCIESYYTFRAHYPPIFEDRDLDKISFKNTTKTICTNMIESQSEYKYSYTLIIDPKLELMCPEHLFAITDIMTDLTYSIYGPNKGHIAIVDGSNVKISLALKINLISAKVYFEYVQQAIPVHLKEVHIVNVSPGIEKLFQLMKPVLGSELLKLVHMHKDLKELRNHVNEEYISSDIGGTGPSYKDLHDDMLRKLKDYKEYIEKDALDKVDESKRLGKSVDSGELFGIEGTFKKLEID